VSQAPADVDSLRGEIARLEEVAAQTERRARASLAVSRVLAEETAIDTAMPRILAALGTAMQAKLGAFWIPSGSTLEVRSMWAQEPYESALWEQLCRRHRLVPGAGLPGTTWRDRAPTFLADLMNDSTGPRREGLLKLRVRTGFGFPILIGSEVAGVIELFSTGTETPDDHLIEVLRTIGANLGQFVSQVRTQEQLRAQIEQQKYMVRASQLFSTSLDVDDILSELAKLVVPWLGDWCAIDLAERDGTIRLAASHHGEAAIADRVRSLLEHRPPAPDHPSDMQTTLKTQKTQFIARVTDDHLQHIAYDPNHLEALRALAMSSYVVVPIIARGVAVAAITVARCGSRRPLSGEDVMLAEELASRAGLAVANARLYTEAHSTSLELVVERETLTKLNDIGRTISAELDPAALVQSVTTTATQLTGAQFGAFYHNASGTPGEAFSLATVTGISREAFGRFPKNGLFAPSFDNRGPVRIDDVTLDSRYARNPLGRSMIDGHLPVRSFMSVPIATRAGTVLGGLVFGHEKPKMFSERAQRIAVGLAANAATAMDNARLYSDAQRLIKELEKTNAELDQFAYVASHDLRAPLRGISNLAMWVEEDLGPTAEPRIVEQLQLLKGRAARMDKLINGLLELARVGRTRQKPERVDVTELLHETIDLLSPPTAARVLIVGAMPTLFAEKSALSQVFLNLIANALQHSMRPDVLVRITATERADDWELAVADNGVGIAPEHHERVWQIFQTLASRDIVETTGIGLTIVKKQVEAHGGRAWIDDTVREGATVRFTWPVRAK
jgi:signal transduction histidine kinase